MNEIFVRFLIGGLFVSVFAALGDVLKPKSFAGLFGAAPAVALATITLTMARNGVSYVAIESRSMIAGAIGFFVYASCVAWILMHYEKKTLTIAVGAIPVWFAVAMLWKVWLK